MEQYDITEVLALARDAAQAGAQIAIDYSKSGSFKVDSKSALELVSTADTDAEKAIVATIRSCFPDHEFLTEEQYPNLDRLSKIDKPLWIIDPIDGTTNYIYGLAPVGISIGFFADGAVQAGVVAAPFLNEEFTAIRGRGAFLNGERIRVRKCAELKAALIATGFPYNRSNVSPLVSRVEAVLKNCRDVRRLGAASLDLCYVGCGRLDAYYETIRAWDMAAGLLIAREGGAVAGHLNDKRSSNGAPDDLHGEELLVTVPEIFAGLKSLLEHA